MPEITPIHIAKQMQLEMCICTIFINIESYFQDSVDEIKKLLYEECAAIKNRYQTDLSYKQEDLGSDLFAFYNKISFYTQSTLIFYVVVERLLCEFESSEKLGEVVKIINDCLMNAFRFLKDHTKQRRNYIAERIIELEEKLRVQVPGHCNRCRKFIMSRDIEETKVLIGAGQFKDPFNLFEMGMSDLLMNHKMQEDIEYKLKYAEVWDNKKKIEEKLHMMLIDCDKKAYGIAFSVSEIEKLESVIKTIATQFALNRDGMEKRDNIFTENLEKLVKIIFYKIKAHQVSSKSDREVQTETHELMKIEEITKNSEKLNKKMNDLKKRLINKEKEISDMMEKNSKQAEENSKGTLEKNTMEIVMRNLVSQHVEESKRIESLFNDKKEQQNKIKFLEKETNYLKNEIEKLNDQIIIENAQEKQSQFVIPQNQKSAKSLKNVKSKKNIHDGEEHEENYSNIRNKWRDSNESSINENLRRSRVIESMRKERIENSGKSSKIVKEGETNKENNEIILSKRNAIKKNTELREMSSFSVEKNTKNDSANEKDFKSRVSIALENEIIHNGSQEIIEEKPKSVKKSRNVVKSMRKIQKSVKNQLDDEDDPTDYMEEGNLSTVSNKKIKSTQQKSSKSKSQISQKEEKLEKQEYATQTDNMEGLNFSLIKNNTSLRNSVNVFSNNERNPKGPQKSSIYNGSSNKAKPLVRTSNSKTVKNQSNKEEKILLSTTLPVLTQNENASTNKVEKNESQEKDQLEESETLEKVYTYYERKISQQKNEMQFEGCFNNHCRLSIDNFELYFNQFINNMMNKEKTATEIRSNSIHQNLQTAPVTPKKPKEPIDHKLQPLSVHRFSSLNEQSQLSQRRNQSSLNFSLSNSFSRWEKNSETSTQISPFSISVFNSRLLINKESYLCEMADKLSKMYFSLEEAYRVEKSKYSSELVQINENETNDTQNLKQMKSFHHSSLNTKPDIISLILNKSEIRYMNMIIILLMKLHEVFPEAYETIKKVITKPYSSQNKKLLKMKTKENKDEENNKSFEENSSIRDGIAKLILLHRRCTEHSLPERNSFKNNGTLFGAELKKVSDWKENSLQKQKLSIHGKQSLCKHLIDFQICLQKDSNLNVVQENENKVENLENQENFNQV